MILYIYGTKYYYNPNDVFPYREAITNRYYKYCPCTKGLKTKTRKNHKCNCLKNLVK